MTESLRGGNWRNAAVPKEGWTCDGVYDNVFPDQLCEMCWSRRVRYVHVMRHQKWLGGKLRVGCVCAGRMEGDSAAPKKRERIFTRPGWVRWYSREFGWGKWHIVDHSFNPYMGLVGACCQGRKDTHARKETLPGEALPKEPVCKKCLRVVLEQDSIKE